MTDYRRYTMTNNQTPTQPKEIKRKKLILLALALFKRLPTTRIAAMIGLHSTATEPILEELHTAKNIIKEPETRATYWRVIKWNSATTP